MKKALQILKIIQLAMLYPFEISKSSKRKAKLRIREIMVAANLL